MVCCRMLHAIHIFPSPTSLAMATKFGTKWAISRPLYKYLQDFCVYNRFSGMGRRMLQITFFLNQPPAMATKFETKCLITHLL